MEIISPMIAAEGIDKFQSFFGYNLSKQKIYTIPWYSFFYLD